MNKQQLKNILQSMRSGSCLIISTTLCHSRDDILFGIVDLTFDLFRYADKNKSIKLELACMTSPMLMIKRSVDYLAKKYGVGNFKIRLGLDDIAVMRMKNKLITMSFHYYSTFDKLAMFE